MFKKRINYLIFFIIVLFLNGCYHVSFEKEFDYLQQRTKYQTNALICNYDLCCANLDYEEKINQLLGTTGLSRDTAVAIAILNNKSLQTKFESLGIKKSDLLQANLFTNPEIEAIFGFLNLPRCTEPITGIEVEVLFELTDLWKIPLKSRLAKDELAITMQEVLYETLQVMKITQNTYDNLMLAQLQLVYQRFIKNEFDKLLSSHLKIKQTVGATTKLEAEYLKMHITEHALSIFDYQSDIHALSAELRRNLGLENVSSKPIKLSNSLQNIKVSVPTCDDLINSALKNNPKIHIANLLIKKYQDKLKFEQANIFESIKFGVSLTQINTITVNQPGVRPDTIQRATGPMFDMDFPLFDQNQAKIAKAHYKLKKAQKYLVQKTINVRTKVIKAYQQLIYELKRIKYYETKTESFVTTSLNFIAKQHKPSSTIKLVDHIIYIRTKDQLLHRRLKYFTSLKIALDKLTDLEISVGKKIGLRFDPLKKKVYNPKNKKFGKKVK